MAKFDKNTLKALKALLSERRERGVVAEFEWQDCDECQYFPEDGDCPQLVRYGVDIFDCHNKMFVYCRCYRGKSREKSR